MRTSSAAMVQDVFVAAASILEGIRKDRHPIEGTLGVDALSKGDNR